MRLLNPRRVLAAIAVVAAMGALVVPADAEPPSAAGPTPPTTTIPVVDAPPAKASTIEQQLREAYDDASAEEAVTLDAYTASVEKTDAIDAQIAELNNAITTVAGYLDAAKAKVAAAQADLAAGEARRVEVEKALDVERARLAQRAVSAYVSGNSRQVELEVILDARELRELESTHAYSSAIVDEQLNAVDRVRRLESEASALRDGLAANEQAIKASRDAVASYDADLTAKRAQTTALRDTQVAESAHQKQLLDTIRSKKQSYLQRLQALQRESDGISIILKTAQASQQPVLDLPVVRTPLDKPVVVESPFGMRLHPIFQEMRLHTGADLSGVVGQTIRAAAAGKVVLAATQDGYGNVVVIDHGGQIATAYAHMTKFTVKAGDIVARGQIIGTVGATGYATGPHLHFEYRVSGAPIDPIPHTDFDEPLPGSCDALARSKDPADAALLRTRADCTPATTTTIAPATTTTTTPSSRR